MKNKLLIASLIGIVAISITGCGKKQTLKEVKVTGPRIYCVQTEKSNGITIKYEVTRKFNEDNYLIYQVSKTTQKFDDKDTYKSYVDIIKESAKDMTLNENLDYSYVFDKSNKKITTLTVYNEGLFDYNNISEEEKEKYTAAQLVKLAEEAGAKCKFIDYNNNSSTNKE